MALAILPQPKNPIVISFITLPMTNRIEVSTIHRLLLTISLDGESNDLG